MPKPVFQREKNTMDRDFYEFYRTHRRKPSKVIDQYNYWKKAICAILEIVRDQMIEKEGGVYLEGLGYFVNCIIPGRKYKMKKKVFKLSDKVMKYKYFPNFFPDEHLKEYLMYGTFTECEKKERENRDLKYTLHFYLVKAIKGTIPLSKATKNYVKKTNDHPLNHK